MNREEYIKAMAELDKRKREIQQEYIDTMPVKPNQIVIIDGNEYYLARYHIISYTILPTLYEVSKKGKANYSHGAVYIKNWKMMRPKNA